MPAETRLFKCLNDNYGVLLHDPDTGATASIDAPEAGPVEEALKATGWKLTDILVTHHHADHTGGIMALKNKYRCRVVAPEKEAGKIPGVDETVHEGDGVVVGNLAAKVIETPGHTLGHIAYWFPKDNLAFVGDTLFSIGCGRVIEGNAGDDVALAQEAARSAERDAGLLRARIHRRQYPFRAVDRQGQPGAGRARGAGRAAHRRGRADHSRQHRRREAGQPVPARRRARSGGRIGMAGKPADQVFAEIGAEG